MYIQNNSILTANEIEGSNESPSKEIIYQLIKYCIVFSLVTEGFGDSVFGVDIHTNISTVFIFLALLIQIVTKTLRVSKFLLAIFIFILVQTYILNLNNISNFSSIKQFGGLILFSISIFSFISVNNNRIINIVKTYYKLVIFITIISILQIVIFIFLGISIIPHSILSGNITGKSLVPEILGILPRAIGLSTEPASYAIISLPGVYIALLALTNKTNTLNIKNKKVASIVLLGYILSFSLVGYFGLFLCLISIFAHDLKNSFFTKSIFIFLFIGLLFVISSTSIGSKVSSFINVQKDIRGYEYTSSDLSAFALLSNVVVAQEALKSSHYIGTGLNTHKDSYDKTIYTQFQISQVILQLNREDAGSLFIRITSEFGIPGILSFLFFLMHYRLGNKIKPSAIRTINELSLIVLICYCARAGNYINVIFILFSSLYYYSFKLQRTDYDLGENAKLI